MTFIAVNSFDNEPNKRDVNLIKIRAYYTGFKRKKPIQLGDWVRFNFGASCRMMHKTE